MFADINRVPERPINAPNFGNSEGLNIKGLNEINMPQSRGVMAYRKDTTAAVIKEFGAQIKALNIPSEIKRGYSQGSSADVDCEFCPDPHHPAWRGLVAPCRSEPWH